MARTRTEKYGPSRFPSPDECGHEIGRSPAFIYSLISEGLLRAVKLRGATSHEALRVPRDEWERWLRSNIVPAESAEATEAGK